MPTLIATGSSKNVMLGSYNKKGMITEKIAVVCPDGKE